MAVVSHPSSETDGSCITNIAEDRCQRGRPPCSRGSQGGSQGSNQEGGRSSSGNQGGSQSRGRDEDERSQNASSSGSRRSSSSDDSESGGSDRSSERGFAGMDPEQQREIAAKGGRAAHEKGTAHEFDSEEAREAGRKGGQASGQSRSNEGQSGSGRGGR